MEQAQGEVEDKSKATTAGTASPSIQQAPTAADTQQSASAGAREEENKSPSKDEAKGDDEGGDAAGMWMYLDGANPTQHGPLTESLMLKLLRIGTAHKDMMAWSQGMSEWQPLAQIEAFRETSELAATPWLYLGENSEQRGPVSAAALSRLLRQGEVDGMTMAWTTGMGDWKPLGEVSELRPLLQDGDDEEEEEEGMGTDDAPEKMMVFEADDEAQPAYEPPPKKESKRSFMADDGTKFAWDEEKGDWKEVEGDEEEELEEEEEEEEPWKIRRAKQQAKLKAKSKEDKKANRDAAAGQKGGTGAAVAAGGDDDPDTAHWGELLEDAKREAEGAGGGGEKAGGAGESSDNTSEAAQQKKAKKKNKKKRGLQWNKKATNLWVYVKGLPVDIEVEEVREHFSKCGIIATDPLTQQPKIKIYKDDEGHPKGDGSVCYAKAESVEMAINVLHEGQLRPGVTIEVSKAVFQQKGQSFDNTKRLKVNDARVKVARAAAEQALSWAENDDTGATKGGLKIVVVENMFHPSDFEANERFGEELEADLLAEGEKLGPVEKITVFAKNNKGPVVVKFGTAYAASECVKVFDGRFFGGRKLSCHFWDGVTNYTIKEEDEKEEAQRLDAFGDWLEEQELPEELRPRTEA
ncbi:conserved unknown protein [Ectocarpus siliculosus]|uniref:RRM domain-containing protein n=1 Tax=Ectocarpus siliculosus TaxID=2880 RepID=D7G930_ECTSI|nr:conserved unknown protein [Ectocarpus siliculosus]|eukprot:CBJ28191.1 conserved unknown protein [Ectocarpus siliculosus]